MVKGCLKTAPHIKAATKLFFVAVRASRTDDGLQAVVDAVKDLHQALLGSMDLSSVDTSSDSDVYRYSLVAVIASLCAGKHLCHKA